MTPLLAVPNVSEGRDDAVIARLAAAFAAHAELLDTHSDEVHNRSVFTLAPTGEVARVLIEGAGAALDVIWMKSHEGEHPAIGALDVAPVVWLDPADRDRARAEALAAAEGIGELGVPVFLYGELASEPNRRERAYFRGGGLVELRRRMDSGELAPDLGPAAPHPTAGATLVTARPPLAAFNLTLEGASAEGTRAIAAALRESGGGLPGVRAIGLELGARTQVSTNVHDPIAVPLAQVVDRVAELSDPFGGRVVAAEIVGLVPRAALAGFPDDVPTPGFDPVHGVIEERIAALDH